MAKLTKRFIKGIGIFMIIFGLLLNPWIVGKVFSFSGTLDSASAAMALIFEFIILFSGIMVIRHINIIFKKRKEILLLFVAILLMSIFSYFLLVNYYSFGWGDAWLPDPVRHHKVIPNMKFMLQAPDYNNLTEVYLGKRHDTLTTRTNSFGFVDDETGINDRSKTRILLLGDSQTEGTYIHENFADILEKKLNEHSKSDNFEVVNAGLGSYSPIIEYNILKHVGLEFNPKIVILNLDMTDVANDYEYSKSMQFTGNNYDYIFAYNKPLFLRNPGFENAYYKLKLFFRIGGSFFKNTGKFNDKQDPYMEEKIKEKAELKKRNSGNISLDPIYAYSYKNEAEFKKHLNTTLYYIKKIDKLSKENNITFILHSYPHSPQIFKGYACYRESVGLERNRIYSNLIFNELKFFSQKNGIILWLSNDVLKNSEIPPYYPCDMHLNQHGHELIADFLFDNLIDISN